MRRYRSFLIVAGFAAVPAIASDVEAFRPWAWSAMSSSELSVIVTDRTVSSANALLEISAAGSSVTSLRQIDCERELSSFVGDEALGFALVSGVPDEVIKEAIAVADEFSEAVKRGCQAMIAATDDHVTLCFAREREALLRAHQDATTVLALLPYEATWRDVIAVAKRASRLH